MSFKDALREKMTLDRMAAEAEQALPLVRKEYQIIDKDLVRRFLEHTPYKRRQLRDLELYSRGGDGRAEEVLVLDNELPLYRNVAPEEVAMRRSPELKELFHVGNVRKIMSDRDILIARGRQAVAYIHDEAVSGLDLSYGEGDVREIVEAGKSALAAGDGGGLWGNLEMLFELLGYQEMDKVGEQRLFGRPEPAGYRDVVMLREGRPALKLKEGLFSPEDDEAMEELGEVAAGTRPADAEGADVLGLLGREATRLKVT